MVRDVYLATAGVARALIASPTVGVRWNEPSALERMTVGALAAHLSRAVITVRDYGAAPLPDPVPSPVDAAEYFSLATPDTTNLDNDLNKSIRSRADDAAVAGHDGVVRTLDDALVSVSAM